MMQIRIENTHDADKLQEAGGLTWDKVETSSVVEDANRKSDLISELEKENAKLADRFGAKRIGEMKQLPNYPAFNNGLIYSHRDFNIFYRRLIRGEKSAIVSGLNPSGNLHLGHIAVLGVNRFLQQEYGLQLFIPLSDDESYVAMKVATQEKGLRNALMLTKSLLAFGFDPSKTKIVIDQLFTDVYNLAFKLSKGINIATMRAVYDYGDSQNIGLHFYPAVQSAHMLLPQEFGFRNVVVPISADEDCHLRVCRDIAERYGYEKVAALHTRFLPGIDGKKMSKSKENGIFLIDTEKEITKKIMSAFSGGRQTVEEHRRLGGVPEMDVAFIYLKYIFLDSVESQHLHDEYRGGRLLSGELKKMLAEKVLTLTAEFRQRFERVTARDIARVVLTNDTRDVESIAQKLEIA